MADKRSFLKFPVTVDVARLAEDFARIPPGAWQSSYWPFPHGSVDLVLLRGGTTGSEMDFYTPFVSDRPVLTDLPYTGQLIGASGPFGGAHFAFLFRMRAGGVARLHRDGMPIWNDMYRIHIAISTAPAARLVVEDRRAQHFAVGEVWSFDNQALHAVINGDAVRTHLILDVPDSNPKMAALREGAEWFEGEPVTSADWARVS